MTTVLVRTPLSLTKAVSLPGLTEKGGILQPFTNGQARATNRLVHEGLARSLGHLATVAPKIILFVIGPLQLNDPLENWSLLLRTNAIPSTSTPELPHDR